MAEQLPRTTKRELAFANGTAIGVSNRWEQGQYCSILTRAGIVGCGIYDLKTAAEFGQAIAIAKGTPAKPLVEPEDLFEAKIVGVTPKAEAFGITPGMTGREAVELMLQASKAGSKSRTHSSLEGSAMHPLHEQHLNLTRRQFFGATGLRLGGAALAMLAGRRSRPKRKRKRSSAFIRRCRAFRTSRRRRRPSSTCT